MTELGKNVFAKEKGLNRIIENIGKGTYDAPYVKGFEGVEKNLFERYMSEHPEFSRLQMSDLLPESNTLVAKIGHILTLPFQASDKISRFVSFGSSAEFASVQYQKFVKNLKKMKRNEAVAELAKDIHLKQFKGIERQQILDAINFSDLTKNKEFLYQFSKSSVKSQIFDYSRYGSQYLKDKAMSVNPIFAQALTFTSWPMYYSRLLKGALDSYKAGDRRPLLNLIAMGSAMYVGTSMAIAESDSPAVKEWASYAKGKTPGLAPLGLVQRGISSPAGIYSPIAGAGLWGISKGLNFVSELSGENHRDSIDFMENLGQKTAKSYVGYRKYQSLRELYDQIRGE